MRSTFSGPLFLVGFGRSGTKLLRAILAGHPRIVIGNVETNFLPSWIMNWGNYGDLSNRDNFDRFYAKVIEQPYFVYRRERSAAITADAWYATIVEFSAAGVFEALIRHDCGVLYDHEIIWGDKSPNNTRYVGLLKEAFPRAKFVHIVRDVRDVALSSVRAWGSNPIRVAQRWADSVLEPGKQATSFAGDLLEIRYEDLTNMPEMAIQNICGFLGIEYYVELINLRESPENLGDAKGRKAVMRRNSNKAMECFSTEDINRIEAVSSHALSHFRYRLTYKGPTIRVSSTMMAWYRVSDGLRHLRRETRARGLYQGFVFVWGFFLQNIRSRL